MSYDIFGNPKPASSAPSGRRAASSRRSPAQKPASVASSSTRAPASRRATPTKGNDSSGMAGLLGGTGGTSSSKAPSRPKRTHKNKPKAAPKPMPTGLDAAARQRYANAISHKKLPKDKQHLKALQHSTHTGMVHNETTQHVRTHSTIAKQKSGTVAQLGPSGSEKVVDQAKLNAKFGKSAKFMSQTTAQDVEDQSTLAQKYGGSVKQMGPSASERLLPSQAQLAALKPGTVQQLGPSGSHQQVDLDKLAETKHKSAKMIYSTTAQHTVDASALSAKKHQHNVMLAKSSKVDRFLTIQPKDEPAPHMATTESKVIDHAKEAQKHAAKVAMVSGQSKGRVVDHSKLQEQHKTHVKQFLHPSNSEVVVDTAAIAARKPGTVSMMKTTTSKPRDVSRHKDAGDRIHKQTHEKVVSKAKLAELHKGKVESNASSVFSNMSYPGSKKN